MPLIRCVLHGVSVHFFRSDVQYRNKPFLELKLYSLLQS